jgi:type IV secretory pathway TrbF-like protein
MIKQTSTLRVQKEAPRVASVRAAGSQSAGPESRRHEPVRPAADRTEPGRSEPGRSEPRRADALRPAPRAIASAAAPRSADTNSNPYLEARREWNERYGDYIHQAQHWRTMAIVSGLVALVAVIGIAYIGSRSKVVPYVVEVDKLGQAAAVARFVSDWRTVTIDRPAQKGAIDRVYSMLPNGSIALSKLNEFFKAHNPFARPAGETVAVAVTNILPISDKTWQVEWQEVVRDLRGQVQGTVRMKVSILVGITPPTQENLILINPLGVYITDLNWSQQL